MSSIENKVYVCNCHSFGWKPIIAGALIAVGLTFLLNLFSVAIGLTAYTTDNSGIETLAFGGLIATSLGVIAVMFAAGWITGYLAKPYCLNRDIGAIYGFLAWSIALIIAIFIAMHAQEYVSFYGHFISGTMSSFQVSNSASPGSNIIAATSLNTNSLVVSTYIIFILFFLSAFACTLGGHVGMRHRYQAEVKL